MIIFPFPPSSVAKVCLVFYLEAEGREELVGRLPSSCPLPLPPSGFSCRRCTSWTFLYSEDKPHGRNLGTQPGLAFLCQPQGLCGPAS